VGELGPGRGRQRLNGGEAEDDADERLRVARPERGDVAELRRHGQAATGAGVAGPGEDAVELPRVDVEPAVRVLRDRRVRLCAALRVEALVCKCRHRRDQADRNSRSRYREPLVYVHKKNPPLVDVSQDILSSTERLM